MGLTLSGAASHFLGLKSGVVMGNANKRANVNGGKKLSPVKHYLRKGMNSV